MKVPVWVMRKRVSRRFLKLKREEEISERPCEPE